MSKLSQALKSPNTAEQLTFFAEAFPANPPALLESASEQPTIAGSGLTFCAWCLKSNPCGCWRRTLAECLALTLQECNSVNGLRTSLQLEVTNSCPSSWLLKTLARRTEESESSLWRTPQAQDDQRSLEALEVFRAKQWERYQARKKAGAKSGGPPGLMSLTQQVAMWATPRANKIGGYSSENWRPTLEQQVTSWPTPTTAPQGGRQKAREAKQLRKDGSLKMAGRDLATEVQVNGQPDPDSPNTNGNSRAQLNYRWVAQLQGFPSDWLDGIE